MGGYRELAFDLVDFGHKRNITLCLSFRFRSTLLHKQGDRCYKYAEASLVRGRIVHDLFFGRFCRFPADEFGRLFNNQLQEREWLHSQGHAEQDGYKE